ncbi:MAG: twin-arginine translocase TatA/TatE family subunit [Bdellovibrionales bacterium]|nr:twin-arginine translocase TatA/TatE family subunit [Bdellovibrionales bacterium]
MFGLSLGHVLILLVVVLLFGAKRLPELGSALGKGLRAFRKGIEGPLDDEGTKKVEGDKDRKD